MLPRRIARASQTHGGLRRRLRAMRRAVAAVEVELGFCHVCGERCAFLGDDPIDFPCKRNSFLCQGCGASARNRHLAQCVLAHLPTAPASASLRAFAANFRGRVWLTATTGAIADALGANHGCVASEFHHGAASGETRGGVLCQDLQATSFADASFGLVVTEDVLEHVADPRRAFLEIRRVLRPGGLHIATVPVNWFLPATVPRAVIEGGTIRHLLPPEYHGDPLRPDGILAFTEFGQDVAAAWFGLIGPTEIDAAHLDRERERRFGIFNNWVFISRKPA
jgi:SAM-dependent methyltransferase